MRRSRRPGIRFLSGALTAVITVAVTAVSAFPAARRPPILFVSRNPPGTRIPGLTAGQGPLGRTLAPGGALFVLEPGGAVRPFLRDDAFFDVCDPSVSCDGTRVVFAAAEAPDSPFLLYRSDVDGANVRAVTAADGNRYDDFDPCWLPDGRIVFTSTRFAMDDQIGGEPVTNLHVVHEDGSGLHRITTDRNGAEEPAVDPVTGRVVYSRWWFNPYRADDTAGVTTDPGRAAAGERVDLWQAVSISPDGEGVKLAAGNPMNRAEQMLYQAAIAHDGAVFGINAAEAALFPEPGASRLAAFDAPIGPLRALTPPGRAASPAILDEGTILFSWSAGPGDLDLCIVDRRGGPVVPLLDRPGTDELDAVPLQPRTTPPILQPVFPPPMSPEAKTDVAVLHNGIETFRFDCLNVFTNGDVDAPIPDAPTADPELMIRFYAALSRPGSAHGDSLVLVREAPLTRTGAVHEHDLPADVPMFEQIVDREGRIVRTANGPAHVPGFNYARLGAGTKCVGCHSGHSTLPVPINHDRATWFNAAPSATVAASSIAPGTSAGALVDRRAAGPVERTGWVARGREGEWIRLSWRFFIEARTVIVYAAANAPREGTDLTVDEMEVILLKEGREVGRSFIRSRLDSKGSRIEMSPVVIDAIELRPRRVSGHVLEQSVVALSEIEVTARLVE